MPNTDPPPERVQFVAYDTFEGSIEMVGTEAEARALCDKWLDSATYDCDGFEEGRPAQIGWAQVIGRAGCVSRREPTPDDPPYWTFVEKWETDLLENIDDNY